MYPIPIVSLSLHTISIYTSFLNSQDCKFTCLYSFCYVYLCKRQKLKRKCLLMFPNMCSPWKWRTYKLPPSESVNSGTENETEFLDRLWLDLSEDIIIRERRFRCITTAELLDNDIAAIMQKGRGERDTNELDDSSVPPPPPSVTEGSKSPQVFKRYFKSKDPFFRRSTHCSLC